MHRSRSVAFGSPRKWGPRLAACFKFDVFVVLAAAALLCATTAHADPVRCSNEAKTCTAACGALPDGQRTSACITICQARMASCRQTGCWDNGSFRYCGLLRQ